MGGIVHAAHSQQEHGLWRREEGAGCLMSAARRVSSTWRSLNMFTSWRTVVVFGGAGAEASATRPGRCTALRHGTLGAVAAIAWVAAM